MQKKVNFLWIFLVLSSLSNICAQSDTSTLELKSLGDSLFLAKKYTDAKPIFDELYFQKNEYSDDLLLKLAYINEGLNNIAWSQYFLETYLTKFPNDENTKAKITEIAEKHQLKGYKHSDLSELLDWISPHKTSIITSLFIAFCSIFIMALFTKKVRSYLPILLVFAFLIMATSWLFNDSDDADYGIIIKKSLLMSQPSAGADLLNKAKPGHKIILLEEFDIWRKIKFDNKECYILKNNIKKLD